MLIPLQQHQTLLDVETMKVIVTSSFQELEFLVKQLESVKELKGLVDEKFERIRLQGKELDQLLRSSPKELITENHRMYLEILQDYFLSVRSLTEIWLMSVTASML